MVDGAIEPVTSLVIQNQKKSKKNKITFHVFKKTLDNQSQHIKVVIIFKDGITTIYDVITEKQGGTKKTEPNRFTRDVSFLYKKKSNQKPFPLRHNSI